MRLRRRASVRLVAIIVAALTAGAGAGIAAVPAQAAATGPSVRFTKAPSVVQLPAYGKTGTFTVSVEVLNPRVDPNRMTVDPYNVQTATITQNSGSSTALPVLTYADTDPLNATFTVYGGVNNGTLGGVQTLEVAVIDGLNGDVFTVSKRITLISHDGKVTAIAGVSTYKAGKRFTVQATSTRGSVGAKATVYFAKKGSKKYRKVATASIHTGFGIGGPASAFRFVSTKLTAGGHLYIVIQGTYTAKMVSKKYLFTVKKGHGSFR